MNFGQVLRRASVFGDRAAIKALGQEHEGSYAEQTARVAKLWQACLAGAAVINPLNPRLAPDELVCVLEDSGTRVIFVDADFAGIAGFKVPRGWTFQTEPLPLSAAAKVLKREPREPVTAR